MGGFALLLIMLLMMQPGCWGAATTTAPASAHRNQLRLQQLEEAQHHHLRHEQHLRAELEGEAGGNHQPPPPQPKKTFELSPLPGQQQHHLRHHNRHHLTWEQRVFPALRHQHQHLVSTTSSPVAANHSRYFDREGIYPSWAEPRSTSAPNWQQELDSSDEDDDDDDEDEDYAEDEIEKPLAKQMPRYSLFSQKLPQIPSPEEDYDAYDQLEEATISNSNTHPGVANDKNKPAAKRNIFDWIFKREKEKLPSTEKPHLELAKNENSLSGEDSDTDSEEEGFSNEQWNKIEHEHLLKQQKHQKELQALRESSRNTPLIRTSADIDNKDAENIYSRNYITGKLTQKKVEQLGTPEAVIKSHRLHRQKQQRERALAMAHLNQVLMETNCQVPQRRCERIQDDPSKLYTPHCTVLHRCSEDSGCCHSRTQICAAKSTRKVELYFFVRSNKQHRPIIEKQTFLNHTECHCIERANFKANEVASTAVVRATILSCTCPRSFEKILQDDGQCRCDCSSGNSDCDWLKRGNEHFSMDDRKCIQRGQCKPPTCEYGQYMDKHGRCPKQHEQPVYNAMS